MFVIVCVDDKMGLSFAKKRQSMDTVLRQKLLQLCNGKRLWMREYTAKQFEGEPTDSVEIKTSETYLAEAQDNDYCFVEIDDILPYADKINGIVLCRWNRVYPSDKKLLIPGKMEDWTIHLLEEFSGKSHKKITLELWEKRA